VEIVIDQVGKPTLSSKKKKIATGVSHHENKKEIWSDSPWTSDIFSQSAKLNHIKELPLPPCEDMMTFPFLRNILIEKHLDELDTQPSSSTSLHLHQYLNMERVRSVSRISLVSRHIDKHNSLAGEGQAGSSLARLEIATSTQKKRTMKVNSSPPPSPSTVETDLLSHPLTSSATVLDSPLTYEETPVQLREDRRQDNSRQMGDDDEEEEEEEEELMTYGAAEEALEKMVLLQTRMRVYWAALIDEFAEKGGGGRAAAVVRVRDRLLLLNSAVRRWSNNTSNSVTLVGGSTRRRVVCRLKAAQRPLTVITIFPLQAIICQPRDLINWAAVEC
jgi:hypothetical protein